MFAKQHIYELKIEKPNEILVSDKIFYDTWIGVEMSSLLEIHEPFWDLNFKINDNIPYTIITKSQCGL